MHAVGTFINEDRDRSIGSSIGNVLDHFFHDEWITHHKPRDPGRPGSSFATQNVSQVEFREEHKSRAAEAALYNALQIREGFAALVVLKNSTMSGWPTADLSAATTASNGLELVRLKRSTSTFATVILFSVTTLMDEVRPIASERAGDHATAGDASRKVRTWLTNVSWC